MIEQNIYDVAKLVSDLTREAQVYKDINETTPVIKEVYGRQYLYARGELQEIEQPEPLDEYYPEKFVAATLNGLIDWIKADNDKLFADYNPKALVVVESPTNVSVYSHSRGERKRRICYASCTYTPPDIPFDTYKDSEFWNTKLQSCFIQDDCRDTVLKIMNNMTEEQSVKTADDGISQRVTVTTGVQGVDTSVFKNPAWLRPMRTFPEVTQPVSSFIVRFEEGKKATLIEGDGGKWKIDAIRSIGKYLMDSLADTNVVVIA